MKTAQIEGKAVVVGVCCCISAQPGHRVNQWLRFILERARIGQVYIHHQIREQAGVGRIKKPAQHLVGNRIDDRHDLAAVRHIRRIIAGVGHLGVGERHCRKGAVDETVAARDDDGVPSARVGVKEILAVADRDQVSLDIITDAVAVGADAHT